MNKIIFFILTVRNTSGLSCKYKMHTMQPLRQIAIMKQKRRKTKEKWCKHFIVITIMPFSM